LFSLTVAPSALDAKDVVARRIERLRHG
jgi:hypothetical protein